MCLAYDCTYFTDNDLIWGHVPNNYVTNGYRKSDVTEYLMDKEADFSD